MRRFHTCRRAASIVIAAQVLFACTPDGLSLGNVVGDGKTVTFRIANDSNRKGDAVFWIEQNGMRACERITEFDARQSYNMRVHCPTLQSGQFGLKASWADAVRNIAVVAERIN